MPTRARISAALARNSASESRSRGSDSKVSTSRERPRRCRPIMTFSNTLTVWKTLVRWNVRARPSEVTSCGFRLFSEVPR